MEEENVSSKELKKLEKERSKREKEERRQRAKEEKARLKAEKKEAKERKKREKEELRELKKREKEEALEELQDLPEVEEGEGEALYCGPEVEECVVVGEEMPAAEEVPGEPQREGSSQGAAITEAAAVAVAEAPTGDDIVLEVEEVPPEEERVQAEEKESWFSRLRKGLSKSRGSFVAPLSKALASRRFDDVFWQEVEDILVGADVGMEMTIEVVGKVRERMARDKVKDPDEVLGLFREVLAEALDLGDGGLRYDEGGPSVFMIVGVNGTGKTTTIAKLAHLLRLDGKRVLLAAGDTFRAAGIEQLETWGNRVGVHTVKHKQGADAAAVIHDAVESAVARDMDVVIADTAGRLHTKSNLMEELKKIKRVAEKNAAVTETLLVIDATTGQNGLIQAREFKEAVEVTGVVLTKLDGTAKGGIVIAIVHELGIPIKFIGVGEKVDDLHAFEPHEFAAALFS
jgi:fused signal recognition particle receptor